MMSMRALRRAVPSALAGARLLRVPAVRAAIATPSTVSPYLHHSTRFQSTDAKEVRKTLKKETPPTVYTYKDIQKLVTHPDTDKIIVDVREPNEFQEGAIPGAVNIPYKSTPGALDLSPEEFEDVFKFKKPSKDKELIFYCLAGVRSTAAADLAQIFGYEKLGNYVGSWEDWVSHESNEKVKDKESKNKEKAEKSDK